MDDVELTLPPDLDAALSDYYRASQPSPEFALNLQGRLLHTMAQADSARQGPTSPLRRRPALLALLILVILLLLAGVAYAIGNALGFVPGVGLVDRTVPVRVLVAPVIAKRQGLTVTISAVISDASQTFLAYRVEGIPVTYDRWPTCGSSPQMRLPNGSNLGFKSSAPGGMHSELGQPLAYDAQVRYAPIPQQVEHVTVVMPCILANAGPQNWEIPLTLVPAPPDFATPAALIAPTFVASGPRLDVTPTSETPASNEAPPISATAESIPDHSGLYLQKVIDLPDSYILVGNFVDAGDLIGPVIMTSTSAHDYAPQIDDGNGKPVDFQVRDDIQSTVAASRAYSWAYEIPKPVAGPLKLIIPTVKVDRQSIARFQFDTGANPQPMQQWALDIPLHLANYDYVVDSVQLIQKGYVIHFHSGLAVPEGTSFFINIQGRTQAQGFNTSSSESRLKDSVLYSTNFIYIGPPPTGILTVELTLIDAISLDGPWTLIWSPPSAAP